MTPNSRKNEVKKFLVGESPYKFVLIEWLDLETVNYRINGLIPHIKVISEIILNRIERVKAI